jgi:hypothetical protein
MAKEVTPIRKGITKAEQEEMFEECERDQAIENKIKLVQECQDQRMIWGRDEKKARVELAALLKEKGFKIDQHYKRKGLEAWMEAEDVKVKVRVKTDDELEAESQG